MRTDCPASPRRLARTVASQALLSHARARYGDVSMPHGPRWTWQTGWMPRPGIGRPGPADMNTGRFGPHGKTVLQAYAIDR